MMASGKQYAFSAAFTVALESLQQAAPAETARFIPLLHDEIARLTASGGGPAAKRIKHEPIVLSDDVSALVTFRNVSVSWTKLRGKADLHLEASRLSVVDTKGASAQASYSDFTHIVSAAHPRLKGQMLVVLRSKPDSGASDVVLQVKVDDKSPVIVSPDLILPSPPTLHTLGDTIAHLSGLTRVSVPPNKQGLPCHMRVTEGCLYLLDAGILFVPKALFIPLDTISGIKICGGTSRTFDVEVALHSGAPVEFSMLSREAEPTVGAYLHERIHSSAAQAADANGVVIDDPLGSDGEDFDPSEPSSSESGSDEEEDEGEESGDAEED